MRIARESIVINTKILIKLQLLCGDEKLLGNGNLVITTYLFFLPIMELKFFG